MTYRVEFGGGAQVQFHGLPEAMHAQVPGKWYPPDEIVGQDEDDSVRRPGASEDQPDQAKRAENLTGERDGMTMMGAPDTIRTCAHGSGGRCSIP